MADTDEMALSEEYDLKYPNRPKNHGRTLPFHTLHLTLFNPLMENKKKPSEPGVLRRKVGPHGPGSMNPHEKRQNIIERFIARWRKDVGNDIFPAFRLIIPERDRERPMYGLKETTIAKLLIQVMKITKASDDGQSLLNWKQPTISSHSRMAGDFAGRCYEVISKRPILTSVGDMTIDEVNRALDGLAVADYQGQARIFSDLYMRMNADELMWLIRMVLRQMKIGATERTFFNIWHPDAESLFNISSNLRRVCWELYQPSIRLEGADRGISLMQCFQPQLAQFQSQDFRKVVQRMQMTENDPTFWIEEKLDGERMQLHMIEDDETPGGKRFCWWSRKAKDYSYLYGSGLQDDKSAVTRHIKTAFHEGVQNIILDGEMITWDPKEDMMVPFGTLKTAAIGQRDNPYDATGWRPFYRIFDCLFLNGQDLTQYTLRDRRSALDQAVMDVHRRFEKHTYQIASSISDIETQLRRVIAEASEGLVLKNPRSAYRLNQRNDDWMKVKPEYMNEFGENLDCVIIGGYYGSGRRGGKLSSFMCGLRVDENHVRQGANPMKFYSFFKVGGGFTVADYAAIRHHTDGKWKKWDAKRPPTEYIALAGDTNQQYERPDEWIIPSDSVVLEVKAASVAMTDQFKMGFTLRFPRFKKMRSDRSWDNALSISGFMALKAEAERTQKEKHLDFDSSRRKRQRLSHKKPLTFAGGKPLDAQPDHDLIKGIFQGLTFFIMTGAQTPKKISKSELERLVKTHGGEVVQTKSLSDVICIGNNKAVQVASAMKRGDTDIIRPTWILDNIKQCETDNDRAPLLLPLEPRHIFHGRENIMHDAGTAVDQYRDSYACDCTLDETRAILEAMPTKFEANQDTIEIFHELDDTDVQLLDLPGFMFEKVRMFIDNGSVERSRDQTVFDETEEAKVIARFAGAQINPDLSNGLTHVLTASSGKTLQILRRHASNLTPSPRFVTPRWVLHSWNEKTRLDEERFIPQ